MKCLPAAKKRSPRPFPLGAPARPKTLRASSHSYCRTTPVMRPARSTRSMEDSRPPDYAASRWKNGLPNESPARITAVRPVIIAAELVRSAHTRFVEIRS